MLNRGSSSATLRKPLPVNDVTFASKIISITDVLAASAGAAGTKGTLMLSYGPVASSNGDLVGKFGDSSLVITSTTLITEVPFEKVMALAGANQNNVDAGSVDYTSYLENGEYYVVYETGRIYYSKADANTAASCAYKIRGGGVTFPVAASVTISPLTLAKTTALAASLVVKASAGTLSGFSGVNTSAAAQYIQVHNTASLPAEAQVPVIVLKVDAGENFSYTPNGPVTFATGITICNSSTLATKTIGAADCWIQAEYT